MMGAHPGMTSQAGAASAGQTEEEEATLKLINGCRMKQVFNQYFIGSSKTGIRGSMQQGWGPQGPMVGSVGPMMGQGFGRMLPNMNSALPTRGGGPPVSRSMANMQMMSNGATK